MKAIKIIYSLDTKPLINNRWKMGNKLKETIYMTALSVLYSHLWYDEVELYVDETAYEFLYMLPCRVTKISKNSNQELWMRSKIQAIELQNKPFIHLDTDVFIKKKIDFEFDKIILERRESDYHKHYAEQVHFFNKYTNQLPYWHNNLQRTYSCGVLGFNNLLLRDKFVSAYYQLEKIYETHRDAYQPLKEFGYEPCIVIEQYNLAVLLNYHKITPNLLLKGEGIDEHAKYAEQIGFSHLFGIKKYHPNIVSEIEDRLQRIFPFWYEQVKQVLNEYDKKLELHLEV